MHVIYLLVPKYGKNGRTNGDDWIPLEREQFPLNCIVVKYMKKLTQPSAAELQKLIVYMYNEMFLKTVDATMHSKVFVNIKRSGGVENGQIIVLLKLRLHLLHQSSAEMKKLRMFAAQGQEFSVLIMDLN